MDHLIEFGTLPNFGKDLKKNSQSASEAGQLSTYTGTRSHSTKKSDHRLKDDDLNLPFRRSVFNFHHIPVAKASGLFQLVINCLYMSQVFYSTALLYSINNAIGCVQDQEIIQDCDVNILHMRPGALVFSVNITSRAFVALFFFPMVGASIDTTSHRRRRIAQASIALLAIIAVELFLTKDYWVAFLVLDQIVIGLTQFLYMIFYAYFLELRQVATTRLVLRLSSESMSLGYLSQLLFMLLVVGLSFAVSLDTAQLGRLARGITLIITGIPLVFAYRLYPDIPPLRQVPEEEAASLLWWKEGLQQVLRTIKTINERHTKGFKWFLYAIIFTDAATQGTVALSAAFFTEFYGMNEAELGLVMLGISVTFIFGARFSRFAAVKMDPINGWKYSIVTTIVTLLIGLLGFFHKNTPVPLLVCWASLIGFCLGWYYASKLACFAMMAPTGHSTELGGIMSLFEVSLSWAPSLLFNILVHFNVPYNWGLMPLCVFGAIGAMLISRAAPWRDIRRDIRNERRLRPTVTGGDDKKEAKNQVDFQEVQEQAPSDTIMDNRQNSA